MTFTAAPAVRRPRVWLAGGVLPLVLCLVVALHLSLGAAGVGFGDLLAQLVGEDDQHVRDVLVGARLPRTLTGLVVGVALGVSGALIQGATRNPLAAPDTLGVNAGAYLFVVLVAYTGVSLGPIPSGGAAFIGGVLAIGVVYLLSSGGVLTPGRMLLAGATVAMAGSAAAEFLQIMDEHATQGLFFWGNGTLMQSGLDRPAILGGVVLLALLAAPLLARPLDLLALGDETAQAMGVSVSRVRGAAFLLAVLLAALAVTLAGPIGFVGLIAPVIARRLSARRHAILIPMSGLVSALILLGADASAQLLFPPSAGYGELPVGVVTALIGGPVFIMLARRITTGEADTGAAVTVSGQRRAHDYLVVLLGAVAALALAIVLALRVGDVTIGFGQILSSLLGSGDQLSEAVVSYRLPRILVAALAGACLAVAGVAVQAVVRNPLAEPGLIGVTAGSSAGAVLVILVVPSAPALMLPLAAGVGGVLALGLVLLLSVGGREGRGGLDPTRVVLVGLGTAATLMGLVNVLVVSAQMNISAALTWMAGSTYGRDFDALSWLALPVITAVVLVLAARPVNLLGLGDEVPQALGLALGRARLLILGAAAVLASGTAAAVGAVGFVGLVAPHLARRLAGNNAARTVPLAALLGAVLVVAADALGRWLLAPAEIPGGMMTAVLGAPYLVWLLRRSAERS